jgi:hypothetical protein
MHRMEKHECARDASVTRKMEQSASGGEIVQQELPR